MNLFDESYIFCSEEGVKTLKEAGFNNAMSTICYPLRKYNFFTSRFYSAIDINLEVKPDIVILTNLNQAYYTMIDPFTEAIQIQGRFRRKFENRLTYNNLIHITNVRDLDAKSEDDIGKMVDEYVKTYNNLIERYATTTDTSRKAGIRQQLKNICEDYLLDEKLNIDYFGIDNKYNEERVKSYYMSGNSLYAAYTKTGFFNVRHDFRKDVVGKDDILRLQYNESKISKVKILLNMLRDLDKADNIKLNAKRQIVNELGKTFEGAYIVIKAYNELTPFQISLITDFHYIAHTYKGNVIKNLENALKENDNEKKRFSTPVIMDIDKALGQFMGKKIPKNKTKTIIGEIYSKHQILYNQKGVTAKLNQETIKEYYDVTPQNKEKPNKWKIKKMKPEIAELINKE